MLPLSCAVAFIPAYELSGPNSTAPTSLSPDRLLSRTRMVVKMSEKRINLAALRKYDPAVDNILETASSVAHYKFDSSSETWVSALDLL